MSDTQPGGQSAPQYHAQPSAPEYAAAPAKAPGKTLGIVGLVLAFLLPIVGLVISIVAVVQSRKAKASNVPGVIGIVIGVIGTIGYIILIATIIGLAGTGMDIAQQCMNGAESVQVLGETVSCSEILNDPSLQQQLEDLQ